MAPKASSSASRDDKGQKHSGGKGKVSGSPQPQRKYGDMMPSGGKAKVTRFPQGQSSAGKKTCDDEASGGKAKVTRSPQAQRKYGDIMPGEEMMSRSGFAGKNPFVCPPMDAEVWTPKEWKAYDAWIRFECTIRELTEEEMDYFARKA